MDRLTELVAALAAQPTVTRERVLRRFVEAWLAQQRDAYEQENQGAEMAKILGGRQTVPLEEVVLAQAFQLEALMNVLERQGVIKKADVLAEITWLKAKTPKAR